MPASLANRVRGEQVPLDDGAHLRLLEVIVNEEQIPLWRARCLQTGHLLTVALDGLVQVPTSPMVSLPNTDDYVADYRRQRRRRRWLFFLSSLIIAFSAFYFRDQLTAALEMLRNLSRSEHFPGLPR